jgi:hypothetical protein
MRSEFSSLFFLGWAKWWFVGFGHLLVRGVGVHKHQVLYLYGRT